MEFQKKNGGNFFLKFIYFSRKNIGGIFSQRTGPSPGQVRLSARAPPLPSGGGRRIHSEKKSIFKKIEISEMFCLFFPGDGTFSSLGDSTPPPSPPECGWVHVAPPRGDSPPRWVENARGARGAVHVAVTYQLSWQLSNAREQMLGGGDLFTPKGIYSYPTRLCGSMGLRCPMAIRPKSPWTDGPSDFLGPLHD